MPLLLAEETVSWTPKDLQTEVLGYLSRGSEKPAIVTLDNLLRSENQTSFSKNPDLTKDFQPFYKLDLGNQTYKDGSSLAANTLLENHQGAEIKFDVTVSGKPTRKATLYVSPIAAVVDFGTNPVKEKSAERKVLDSLPMMLSSFNQVADQFAARLRSHWPNPDGAPSTIRTAEDFFGGIEKARVAMQVIEGDPNLKEFWRGVLNLAQTDYTRALRMIEGSSFFSNQMNRRNAAPKFKACPYTLEMEKEGLELAANLAEGNLAQAFSTCLTKTYQFDRAHTSDSSFDEISASFPKEIADTVRVDNKGRLVFDLDTFGGPKLITICQTLEAAAQNLARLTRNRVEIENVNVGWQKVDEQIGARAENKQPLPDGLRVSYHKYFGKAVEFVEERLPDKLSTPFAKAKEEGYTDLAILGASGSGKNMFESGVLVHAAKLNRDKEYLSSDRVLSFEFEGPREGETADDFWKRYVTVRNWSVATAKSLTAQKVPVTLAVFFDDIHKYPPFPVGRLAGELGHSLTSGVGDHSAALSASCVKNQGRGPRVIFCQTGEGLPPGVDPSFFVGHRTEQVRVTFSQKDIENYETIAVVNAAKKSVSEKIEKKVQVARASQLEHVDRIIDKSYALSNELSSFPAGVATLVGMTMKVNLQYLQMMALPEGEENARYYFTNTSITDVAEAIINDPRINSALVDYIDSRWQGNKIDPQSLITANREWLTELINSAVNGQVKVVYDRAEGKAEMRKREEAAREKEEQEVAELEIPDQTTDQRAGVASVPDLLAHLGQMKDQRDERVTEIDQRGRELAAELERLEQERVVLTVTDLGKEIRVAQLLAADEKILTLEGIRALSAEGSILHLLSDPQRINALTHLSSSDTFPDALNRLATSATIVRFEALSNLIAETLTDGRQRDQAVGLLDNLWSSLNDVNEVWSSVTRRKQRVTGMITALSSLAKMVNRGKVAALYNRYLQETQLVEKYFTKQPEKE